MTNSNENIKIDNKNMGIDWMWVADNPEIAAEDMDALVNENEKLEESLRQEKLRIELYRQDKRDIDELEEEIKQLRYEYTQIKDENKLLLEACELAMHWFEDNWSINWRVNVYLALEEAIKQVKKYKEEL